ncbi:MAG: hypothetical protein JW741_01570 [Sedimentisphaerales bacterium]|nr:hypothetical protein [Sedimentisphaerales bacterium]
MKVGNKRHVTGSGRATGGSQAVSRRGASTGWERVQAAVEHRGADGVPADLGGTTSTGISAGAYNSLKRHLGLEVGTTRVFDTVQGLAIVEGAVLEWSGSDIVDVGRVFDLEEDGWRQMRLGGGEEVWYPGAFRPVRRAGGGWGVQASDGTEIAMMPEGGAFFDQTHWPYVDGYPSDYRRLDEALAKVMWTAMPRGLWRHMGEEGFWQRLRGEVVRERQKGRAVSVTVGCNLVELGCFLRRMDNFLMDLALEPAKVEGLMDALVERHLSLLEQVCEHVGDVADIVRFGDDLGMDRGPLMSPAMYRRIFKPRHKAMCEYVKKHSGMTIGLHSCGSIHALIPDLVEAGFEMLNPVQTSCAMMEPERLKADYGGVVTFWGGGCDTREVLPHGTPEEVRAHVLDRMEVFSKGGGFVFSAVHNILPEVPGANVAAMYEAVREFNGERH